MATIFKTWILWMLFIGIAVSTPVDEIRQVVSPEEEIIRKNQPYRITVTPSGYSPEKVTKYSVFSAPKFIDTNNKYYKQLEKLAEKGYTLKGLTFSIYDDNMREAAIALFRMLKSVHEDDIFETRSWLNKHINEDLYDYVLRLAALFINKKYQLCVEPPFVFKPNYYINSETIFKALRLKINRGKFEAQIAIANQFNMTYDSETLTINSNYSGWNFPLLNTCDGKTDYFREDFALNSFYYGIHLLHPFWMTNEELDEMNSRHAEHYLFSHRQLLARYFLEQEHLKASKMNTFTECKSDFYPYLVYDNGLAFPSRPTFINGKDEARIAAQTIEIALNEYISRQIVMLDNGTIVKMTEDSYLQLLPKLLRAHFDTVKPAKIIRALFGYGSFPSDNYNSAPSVLHHAETSLRDHAYWYLMERAINYSILFMETLSPYNISQYDTDQYTIVDAELDNITTYFEYFQLSANRVFGRDEYLYSTLLPHSITARQRKLTHKPFTFKFRVESLVEQEAVVRLFLGPQCCGNTCWKNYHKFFELDSYRTLIKPGENTIIWSSLNSSRFSSENYFNLELADSIEYKYDMFKFPYRLLFPRGLEQGLKLTLFFMISPHDSSTQTVPSIEKSLYKHVLMSYQVDGKPLGFPFHRLASNFELLDFNSFRFYNITIYQKKDSVDDSGYFSPHLY